MEVILTHDLADFDAAASVMAAWKLNPGAKPVLPGRLHRNVADFLTLYHGELPFIQAKDLLREPVERALIVDTQTFSPVRGMDERTRIQVVDHHKPAANLNPKWDTHIEQLGATATLFCERLQAAEQHLTPVEATLMMLGIYSDTGQLSYGMTTTRDIRAAAWLLEQGAMLDVVRDYLQQPLTQEQIDLYEALLQKAEIINVAGHAVLIASAITSEAQVELAILATRLVELFDPAAAVLLVAFEGHVQFVGRSGVDAVDVGWLAGQFAGGGHTRASAARITGLNLEQARARLLDLLPQAVRPGLHVRDVMSYGVRTVRPGTRAQDAAAYMQRYGYEGFPVVEEGHVLGLVTRREVDRALMHGLDGVTVEKLMRAGDAHAHPDDSLTAVQSLMVQTGWGQLPVVSEEGRVLGIITRTDLIKHIGREAHAANKPIDVHSHLEAALPPLLIALMQEAGAAASANGQNLFLVGGFVRDLLLNTPTLDLDFIVEGDAEKLVSALQRRFGGTVERHHRFGTAKWHTTMAVWAEIAAALDQPLPESASLPAHIDLATARTEHYPEPSALPEVEQSSIKLDLHRRDFTINTLTIRLNIGHFGQLFDPYDGLSDLTARRVRVLHSLSFVDDPTRMFRAVRFEQRLGFVIEPRTLFLLRDALPMIERLSGDRIRHEIDLLLEEADPAAALLRADALGILEGVHHAFDFDEWTIKRFERLQAGLAQPAWPSLAQLTDPKPCYYGLMLYRLAPSQAEALGRRLNLGVRLMQEFIRVQQIGQQCPAMPSMPASQLDALLQPLSDTGLAILWAACEDQRVAEAIAHYGAVLRQITTRTDGAALRARGVPPGPLYGQVLRALRDALLDGKLDDAQAEEALLEELLRQG